MEIKAPLLSILIATTSARNEVIKPLLSEIDRQMNKTGAVGKVELIINDHETDCIGKKRNDLLKQAKGSHVAFIDSDDHIANTYVCVILIAIECENTDSIGINGIITTNGYNERKWFISKEYGSWYTGADGTYYRTPNHISPVRRELALQAGFPEVSFAEDYAYSMALLPLLKTECLISRPLYHYDYSDTK